MHKRGCRSDPPRPDDWLSSGTRSSRAIVCVAPILLIGGAFDGNSAMRTGKCQLNRPQRRATELASRRANSGSLGRQSRAPGGKGGRC